jgi:hypothetical protein
MKLDADEKELLDSVERGEWKSAKGGKRERARYTSTRPEGSRKSEFGRPSSGRRNRGRPVAT